MTLQQQGLIAGSLAVWPAYALKSRAGAALGNLIGNVAGVLQKTFLN